MGDTISGLDVRHPILDPPANQSAVSVPYNVTLGVVALYNQSKPIKSGSTIPIKIQLTDASGANVSAPAVVVTATALTMISTNTSGAP